MATKTRKLRFGLYYYSNGRWTGPYNGVTYTAYTWKRNPLKRRLNVLKNYLLKSRVKLVPVS